MKWKAWLLLERLLCQVQNLQIPLGYAIEYCLLFGPSFHPYKITPSLTKRRKERNKERKKERKKEEIICLFK